MDEKNEQQDDYIQNLVNILQKNYNELFAKNVQLEAKLVMMEKQVASLAEENSKLKKKSDNKRIK